MVVEQEVVRDEELSKLTTATMKKQGSGGCLGTRHVLAFLAFLGFVNVYAMRVNLSVALVQMINSTDKVDNHTHSECPSPYGNTTSNTTKKGEFNWNEDLQGAVLSSFFYGYILTQILGGWLAERYGGKKLFGIGVLCTAIFTLLTPIAARLHVGVFLAVRVLEGLGEGVTFPAINAVWARWAPPLERSKLVTFTYAGSQAGTVLSLPISGLLCQYGFAGGWPSVFYVFGALGIVWFVVWMLLVHDSPAEHPRISQEERDYIEGGLKAQHSLTSSKEVHKNLPLVALKSPAVWALTVTHFCYNWGFYTLLTCLPTYMKKILRYDITQDGFLSAVPYLVMWMVILISGQVTDYVRQKGYLRTVTVRKINNTLGGLAGVISLIIVAQLRCNNTLIIVTITIGVGLIGCVAVGYSVNHLDIAPLYAGLALPGAFLIASCYVGCNQSLAVLILTIGVSCGGFSNPGFQVNHLDIAPQFAGTLMGITNTAGTLSGILAPQIVGLLTNEEETIARWSIVFYIAAGLYMVGALVFLLFGTGEVQYWARDDYERTKKDDDYLNVPTERDPLINREYGQITT